MTEQEFYSNLPRLETERLVIRKLTLEDAKDYYAFASDPEVVKYLRWGPHPSPEATEEYLRGVLSQYAEGKDSPWGIELKSEGKIIGSIHLMRLDFSHSKSQVGYVLSRPYWGSGYMTETLNRVLEYCFTELLLNRVEAFCLPDNHASARVLEKADMQFEGLLRQYAYQKGAPRDFRLFAILKQDYQTTPNRVE